jgi:hypothetical protein
MIVPESVSEMGQIFHQPAWFLFFEAALSPSPGSRPFIHLLDVLTFQFRIQFSNHEALCFILPC